HHHSLSAALPLAPAALLRHSGAGGRHGWAWTGDVAGVVEAALPRPRHGAARAAGDLRFGADSGRRQPVRAGTARRDAGAPLPRALAPRALQREPRPAFAGERAGNLGKLDRSRPLAIGPWPRQSVNGSLRLPEGLGASFVPFV